MLKTKIRFQFYTSHAYVNDIKENIIVYHKMSLNSAFSSDSASAFLSDADPKARISGSVSGTVNFSFGGSRPSSKSTYMSNGYRMNSNGYLANPTRSAQIAANNAGALTRSEAASMGLPLGGRR
jgi:hypothetical protein